MRGMMTTKAMSLAIPTDADLVGETLSGDRDAFGRIVSRYQSLICSLAYSATGSLGQSEDLAQETFITAWKHLSHLRERDKLRAWLCGIARNRINGFLRREGREPVRRRRAAGKSLRIARPRTVAARLRHQPGRGGHSLAFAANAFPEIYREPLVLFYREHQSVERVAQDLELSEDAVHQRLSRGRKLLQEQVLAFVEGALERTNPGKAFTLAVLASLPATHDFRQGRDAGRRRQRQRHSEAAGALGWFGALLGPLAVFVPNYIAYRVTLAGAQSEEERAGVKSLFGKFGAITLALFIPLAAIVLWLTRNQPDRSFLSGLLGTCGVLIFLPTIFILGITSGRKSRHYYSRILAEEYAGVFPKPAWEYRSQSTLFGLPLVHIRIGDRFAILKKPVKAWIAVGNAAIGGLFACGGLAIAPLSLGGLSIGMLSLGGLAVGIFALGGIALGVWAFFGGLTIGWQAFVGCFAIAWNAAAGMFALAHDFALGSLPAPRKPITKSPDNSSCPICFFRCAEFLNNHWLWLNLFWLIPFFVQWLVSRRARPAKPN